MRLRQDLSSVTVDDSRRGTRIVVDEIAGRITRVREDLWQALQNGVATAEQWQQARHCGWTRERTNPARTRFSPLYVRISLGSIDRCAQRLAPRSGWLFSSTAIKIWTCVIVAAAAMLIGRRDQWTVSFASLGVFFSQASPIALGACFIATKVAHELAHAVMCRRVGSRCGNVGVLLLCGMPCPFCDVSDSVRQPSRWDRASVMLAGIYVELIIAALASLVWIGTRDEAIRLHAMNLMFVCGVSTLLFNANPLMRYDGYFVLADMINSVNLRAEAQAAFRDCWIARIAGPSFPFKAAGSFRKRLLSCYHAASSIYRIVVSIAIATMMLAIADRVHLRPIMAIIVAAAAIAMLLRSSRRLLGMMRGKSAWSGVSRIRRVSIGTSLILGVSVILWVPLPRFRSATGKVDAINSVKIFLPADAIVDRVEQDFGDSVEPGETLVQLRDESTEIDLTKLKGQLRVAQMRSQLSRRQTMNRGDEAIQWETFVAVENALQTQLVSVQKRVEQSDVRAVVGGIVLPTEASLPSDPLRGVTSLRDRVGTLAGSRHAWCRISPHGQLHAVIEIDARDRNHIRLGSPVRISIASMPDHVFDSVIGSVSPIDDDEQSVVRRAAYEVVCPLSGVSKNDILARLGNQCRAVIRLPSRTLAGDLAEQCKDWFGG